MAIEFYSSEKDNKFEELYRRLSVTSKARYQASRRLGWHNWFSQWTLAFMAIGQIIIQLMKPLGFCYNFSDNYYTLMSIVFSVILLAYSLLLGMGNFSARSVKIHQCGIELGRIARNVKPYIGSKDNDDKYNTLAENYYNCLEKYENHSHIDYLIAHYDIEKSKKLTNDQDSICYYKKLILNKFVLFVLKIRIWFLTSVIFFHYIFSLIALYVWIYMMFAPKQ